MSDPNSVLRQAALLHQSGNLAGAIALYRQLLSQFPKHPPLLNMLGTAELQSGHTEEGVSLLGQSLALAPDQPGVLSNRGCGLLSLGRAGQALDDFDRALALQPGNAEAHANRGNALKIMGRLEDAVTAYGKAIAARSAYAEAHFNRGAVLAEMDRPAEALADFERAIAARPRYAKAHNNRASVLFNLQRPAEALAAAQEALALQPDYAAAHANRGKALAALGRHDEAVKAFDRALALAPEDGDTCYSRGNAWRALNEPEKALADFDRAITLGRDGAETENNRAAALADLGRIEEALGAAKAVIARFPDHAGAHLNHACLLLDVGDDAEGRAALDQALALSPDFPEAEARLAMLELQTGDYASGWARYERRWSNPQFLAAARQFRAPRWTGSEPLEGKTIFIHAEQGFGDIVQFARYVPLLTAARVIFEVPAALKALLATLKGNIELVTAGEPLPDFDVHCPLLSLPHAFHTTLETIPAEPYLSADPSLWSLGGKTRPRVGLMWKGRTATRADARRSLALDDLAPLLACDCEFHALQKDVPPEEAARFPALIVHAPDEMDFARTAALIEAMDLVISVDTSVAHIAGALGKPIWLMLPAVAEWRWLTKRSDSPWYPSATLFRQPSKGDWQSVVAAVTERLRTI